MAAADVHRRTFPVRPEAVGLLLDGLSSPADGLWPGDRWPPMRLDRGLRPGSKGGHGPIRYTVDRWERGRAVWFAFTGPPGFVGGHGFTVLGDPGGTTLEHRLEIAPRGWARLTWALVYLPLHRALLEDCLDRAETALTGAVAAPARWSWRVRALRRILAPR